MQPLTERKQRVLDSLDEEITALEKKLAKIQPLIDELNQLRQTRRVLLSERMTTGGGGGTRQRLSMEQVILYLKEHQPCTPGEIAQAIGVPDGTIRSHLSRNAGTRYESTEEGWMLLEDAGD